MTHFESDRNFERTMGERVFDILGMSELADTHIAYGQGMTAAQYVGEQGNPSAVEAFTMFVELHDMLVNAGHNPKEVPEFETMRADHIRAMSQRLGATYDEDEQRWIIADGGSVDAGTVVSR